MPDFELLVIGGGPAGLATARGYRAAKGERRVGIVSDEQRMPYRRPPLTKELLRGEIDERQPPLEQEQWLRDQAVALISGRAVKLDHVAHELTLSGGRTVSYGSCVIAASLRHRGLPVSLVSRPAASWSQPASWGSTTARSRSTGGCAASCRTCWRPATSAWPTTQRIRPTINTNASGS